jgi:hypothetical protein
VSDMLICRECQWVGDDPATEADLIDGVKMRFQVCPECGSEQIDDVLMCVDCMQAAAMDGDERCRDCETKRLEANHEPMQRRRQIRVVETA